MSDRPARQIRAATSRRRQSWSGWAEGSVDEKDGVGVFLDDVTYVFADVSVFGLPVLWLVLVTGTNEWAGLKTGALVAWLTTVAAGALIRGGWVTPLATDAPGWVAVTPWLVALRVAYYNAALALAAYGGRALGEASSVVGPQWPSLATVGAAFVVGALAAALFPRVAESFYGIVAE
ncbi:hypothetical protein M0R88_17980 [Halorussus gelatinilyticus]|uniref:DUF8215 domain-containing protein n=1 Tax=Halorussus gelatinilyticus TaxID=2937524 RepID=A0A8U0II88_9EURY|nr:hypothetical protein [Halorussus gelatinilyticus]UPW00381.1 hypothetical protein M0R88_17980 [Halorussus gelatinilyticus]